MMGSFYQCNNCRQNFGSTVGNRPPTTVVPEPTADSRSRNTMNRRMIYDSPPSSGVRDNAAGADNYWRALVWSFRIIRRILLVTYFLLRYIYRRSKLIFWFTIFILSSVIAFIIVVNTYNVGLSDIRTTYGTSNEQKTEASGIPDVTELPEVTGNAGEAPTITAPTGTPPATLQTQDIILGTGEEVVATSTLTVHYTLMSWSNGAIVESSWSDGQPPIVWSGPLSGVISGWQQGLPGAKVGGRRLLVIPADLAYGANGSGPIGPNETLIFVVDIVGVS